MRYLDVTNPLSGALAFGKLTPESALSQAALLLGMGAQLRSYGAGMVPLAYAVDSPTQSSFLSGDDQRVFPIPQVTFPDRRFTTADIRTQASKHFTPNLFTDGETSAKQEILTDVMPALVGRLFENADPVIAAELFEICLGHPDELVRVAAAASFIPISAEADRLIGVLAKGTLSDDELTRELAATALARVVPEHPAIANLTKVDEDFRSGEPAHTALLVHGTFARDQSWYLPGGDFHSYLKAGPRPDVYAGGDPFKWSGGYSHGARDLGAGDLCDWALRHHSENVLDIFAHSHGGSVAMLATHRGLRIGKLILLSCPVHVPEYLPAPGQVVDEVVSIRVRMDLVILADGGAQRFPTSTGIREVVLPTWFNHSATHDPDTWRKYDVPERI